MFSVPNAQAQAQAQTQNGPDLVEIQTEGVGFQSIAGEIKLKLLPTPWPSNALPRPTSTLLSIAPRNELLAAAGPSTLVIASTPSVREAFLKEGAAENNTKSFTTQLTIEVPRLSHVAFSSDESYLTICADQGGGLSVYDVQDLKKGITRSAFEIPTNTTPVRALVPNPAQEYGHVVAVVLENSGQLLLANFKERQWSNGKQGPVLKDGVSCMSWSSKGKQLVVGLGNGTAIQMDPEGVVKAEIPRPPTLTGDQHVSGISWLSNDLFFIIYTPTVSEHEGVPDSTYLLVTRQPKTSNYTFQKMQDPVGTFGMNRSPPHHFIQRMRDYPPNLTDTIILSSTGSGDIGLLTCCKVPLSSEPAAANSANAYTTTGIANDARRAQMPVNDQPDEMSDGSMDTSPIGMVMDLSSKENVKRPIPSEEIDISATPLPALMILNNQGILSLWWFVYSEAVRQGIPYPGLVAASGLQTQQPQSVFGTTSQPSQQPSVFGTPAPAQQQPSSFGSLPQTQSAFGSSTAATANTFGKPATPAFGAPTPPAGGFGINPTNSFASFGSSSQTGAKASPWGSGGAGFGRAAFGSPAQLGAGGSAFGASGGLGQSKSPWGTTTSSTAPAEKPANPFANTSTTSPFATFGSQQPSQSAFQSSPMNTASTGKPFSQFSPMSTGSTSATSPMSTTDQPHPSSAFGATSALKPSAQPSTFGSAFGASTNLGQTKSPWDAAKLEGSRAPSPLVKEAFGTNTTADTATDADMDTGGVEHGGQGPSEPSKSAQPSVGSGKVKFELTSTFKANETGKEGVAVPDKSGSSLFGSGFGDALNEAETAPKTPVKEESKVPATATSISTTPASLPKSQSSQSTLFPKPAQTASGQENKIEDPETLEDPPLPPSPTRQKPPAESETPPLPALATPQAVAADQALSPAGSPPVDLGEELGEGSSSPLSSVVSDEENESSDLEEEAPLPPDFVTAPTAPKATWSFPTPAVKDQFPASEETTVPSAPISPPKKAEVQDSSTPAPTIKPPVLFSPPSTVQATPRSPSPQRNARPIAGQRSLTTPTAVPQRPSTTPLGPPPATFLPRASKTTQLFPSPAREERPAPVAEPEIIVDNSDEMIQEELSQPIEATKILAPFIAHQNYIGTVTGDTRTDQAETLYRDIASMIDTLGLNARSLSSFIKGQSELYPDGGRERADLDEDDWCLIEVDDLGVIEKNLTEQLDAERPQEVKAKLSQLRDIQRELLKMRSRHPELHKLAQAQMDLKELEHGSRRSAPLTSEQSDLLSDLRKDFVTFQKQLVEAEDGVSLLKAKLVARQSITRDGSRGGNTVPTVEAVVNTLSKMTRMIEQKSGDVDLLEAQMKKLKFRPRAPRGGTPSNLEEALGRLSIGSAGIRGDSPLATPPSSRSKMAKQGTYQLTYSPDSSDNDDTPSHRRSLRRSIGVSSQHAVELIQLSEAEVAACKAKHDRRRRFLGLLKTKVSERGVKNTG